MSFESFYGGRQGASFVIKYQFDAIDTSVDGAPKFTTKYFAYYKNEDDKDYYYSDDNGNLIERNESNYKDHKWKPIICGEIVDNEKQPKTVDTVLISNPGTKGTTTIGPIDAKGMVQYFKQGGVTTNIVNYGEYVIIDTPNKSDPDNGKVYMRGMDYTNNMGGAIYIGHIVGPQGQTPEMHLINYNDSGFGPNPTTELAENTSDLVPGYIPGEGGSLDTYNDKIFYKEAVLEDEIGNLTGYKIAFQIPYLIQDFTATATNPYKTEGLITEDPSQYINNKWEHPFYEKWNIQVPQGIHGGDVESLSIVYTATKKNIDIYSAPTMREEEKIGNTEDVEFNIIREAYGEEYNHSPETSYDDGNLLFATYCKIFYPANSDTICYVNRKDCHKGVYRYLFADYEMGDPDTGEPNIKRFCYYVNLDLFDDINIQTKSPNSQTGDDVPNDGSGNQKVTVYLSKAEYSSGQIISKIIPTEIGAPINYIIETLVIDNSDNISRCPLVEVQTVIPIATYGHLIVYFSDPALRAQLAAKFPERMLSYPSSIYKDAQGQPIEWTEWFDLGQTKGTRAFPILTTVEDESALYHEVGGEQVAYKPEELPQGGVEGNPPIDELAKGWGVEVKATGQESGRFFCFDYDKLDWVDSGSLNASVVDPHYVIDKAKIEDESTVRVNNGGIWLIQSKAIYADFDD